MSLDDRPQGPEEVGCQREPIFRNMQSVPVSQNDFTARDMYCVRYSADSSPVDFYVERLLHAKLVPSAQVVKPWIRLA